MIKFLPYDKPRHMARDECLICSKSTRGVGGVIARITQGGQVVHDLLYCNRCVGALAQARRSP